MTKESPATTLKSDATPRDEVAERVALSLAQRRGKCAPTLDTKLADAWLGFYVALTKNTILAGSTSTTEAATETSISEANSSHGGMSPRRPGETDAEDMHGDVAMDDNPELPDETTNSVSAEKRSHRPHRRRRTRGKGRKKGRAAGLLSGCIDEDSFLAEDSVDEMDTAILSRPLLSTPSTQCALKMVGSIMSTSPTAGRESGTSQEASARWPFQAASVSDNCPRSILRAEPLTPSTPHTGPHGVVSTNPNSNQTPVHREASARTPPKMRMPFCHSPVTPILTGTPCGFGTPTVRICSGGQAAYQGSHVLMTSPAQAQLNPGLGSFFDIAGATSFPVSPASPHVCAQMNDYNQNQVVGNPVNALQSWLSGGLHSTGEDLAQHLQAAVPEAYED